MRKEMFVAVVLENGPKGPRLAASPSSEDVETVMSLLIGPIRSPVELISQKGKEAQSRGFRVIACRCVSAKTRHSYRQQSPLFDVNHFFLFYSTDMVV
jgi:hypothetical protein